MAKTSKKKNPFAHLEQRALLVLEVAANIEMHHLPNVFQNATRPEKIAIALKAVEIAWATVEIDIDENEWDEVLS